MAETPLKRQREETHVVEDEIEQQDPKRQKSFTHILSLLEEEEDHEPHQDFSSILSTLQQELSCSDSDPFSLPGSETDPDKDNPVPSHGEDDEDERERVMRHLLEASDDELGIPHRMDGGDGDYGQVTDGGDAFGLWELEDEAANYYTLLQAELFM
ncbi:hypothetical protein CsSME_00043665 [Camellia sinensis var. sinensis]|uniref:Uncharacterized protein n=1 Tax=Camellia sinensis var. sinensis TaxID=542762 RepID=A0A4S4E0W7_CAMSN|nr:uncharacterized protein LOC114283148 [Camellia sinensis]THG08756.1 hypothetical protein TEA_020044 [Camellia sinensis var. sinensis]